MIKQYHILNGDALKEQFPENINGEIIVARECLVDGNVEGKNLNELFLNRAKFISNNYEGFHEQDYFINVVPEFQKMQDISPDAEINLWFEDDLFCQVNLWFIINLLYNTNHNHAFLIRPEKHNQFGFGGLSKSELTDAFKNRTLLSPLNRLASLWDFYQDNQIEKLFEKAKELEQHFPYIIMAVNAHIDRFPKNGKPGLPVQTIIQIMKELKTEQFDRIFGEFSIRQSIYGFGDLQVKRLLEEVKSNS